MDDSGIESESGGAANGGQREVTFRLIPGAAAPNLELRIINLDDTSPVVTVTTDAEGGGIFAFTGSDGDQIRLQLVTATRRYEPADFVLGSADGRDTLARVELPSCLDMEPGLELEFDASFAQLSVYNECADTLSLAEPRLRVGTLGEDFELVTLMPVEIGGGISAGIELRMPAGAARPSDDVLFLDAEVGSEQLRYAIGLFAAP